MRLIIVAVGRARSDPSSTLFDDYVRRLPWPLDLVEVQEKRKLAPAELKAREARLLLDATPRGAFVVALDPSGEALDSEAFARRFDAWRERGPPIIAFLIGGAEGLDRALEARADATLSFGAMTWPHLLIRVMLVEQLYRVSTILSGHPYHRG